MTSGPAASSPPSAEWTVLVYMAANNDLADAAEQSLAAMMAAPVSDAVNVAVEIRRPGDLPAGPTTTRYHVLGSITTSDPVVPSRSMAEPATLTDFIVWGLGTYPAKRSLLVIWSHGLGLEDLPAASRDPTRNITLDDGEYMTNQGFRQAIEQAIATLARPNVSRIDVLGCDACLMSMMEIAHEMRGVASFLVAPETDEPRQSWPYTQILTHLGAPGAAPSPATLATTIVQDFGAWYDDEHHQDGAHNDIGYATLTAIQLQAESGAATPIEALASAIDTLADALLQQLPAVHALVDAVRGDVAAMERPDYVDLADFLRRIDTAFPAAVSAAARGVEQALAAVQVAAYASELRAGYANGLSIYFPTEGNADAFLDYRELSFAKSTQWPAFLDAYFDAAGEAGAPEVLPGGLSARGWEGCH